MPWMSSPHYDVKVNGPVNAPRVFDPYSLRQPVTEFLHEQYGVSIRVNGACQEPCGNQESIVVERVPWMLSKMTRSAMTAPSIEPSSAQLASRPPMRSS